MSKELIIKVNNGSKAFINKDGDIVISSMRPAQSKVGSKTIEYEPLSFEVNDVWWGENRTRERVRKIDEGYLRLIKEDKLLSIRRAKDEK